MDREKLEARLKLLETEREQVQNTVLAYEGAIQESRHWLSQLEEKQENDVEASTS
jgi:site-specific recombinase XerD